MLTMPGVDLCLQLGRAGDSSAALRGAKARTSAANPSQNAAPSTPVPGMASLVDEVVQDLVDLEMI